MAHLIENGSKKPVAYASRTPLTAEVVGEAYATGSYANEAKTEYSYYFANFRGKILLKIFIRIFFAENWQKNKP